MSSLALRPGAVRSRPTRRTAGAVLADHGTDVMLGVAVMVLAIVLLLATPRDYFVDSWLALATGRDVWQHGIPHTNTLTVIAGGHRWTDEQWLSQLASYAVYRLGGLGLLSVVNAALLVGPAAAGITIARRRGASFRSVLAALLPCLILIGPSRQIRTQEFAVPLFVAVVWLISSDARCQARSRRVYACLPILVLWANLHGSVTLGAGLVVLYALTLLWERRGRLRSDAQAWRRPALLGAGAIAAILITPYGLAIVGYYHGTMVNGTLRQYVSEWQPITTHATLTLAWLMLCGLAVWTFGRFAGRTTLWEKLALLVLAAGALDVERNALFLGLFGLIVLPVALGIAPGPGTATAAERRRRISINGAFLGLATVGLFAALVATLAKPATSILDARQSPGLTAAVRRAAASHPSVHVLADSSYADLLLWEDPSLAGRMVADVRFELLSAGQLAALTDFFADVGPHALRFARGDRLIVLNRAADAGAVTALLAEPGHRVLYTDRRSLVILRSARDAAR